MKMTFVCGNIFLNRLCFLPKRERHFKMLAKTFKTALALILAVTLSVPLSACQSNKSSETTLKNSGYRWENFDDGSDYLDLEVPYIPSNVNSFSFNVILEQGKFASELNASQVSLAGAIDGWQIENVTRKDDVTATVSMEKPDGWVENGAAIAQIELNSKAIELESEDAMTDEEADAQASSNEEDAEMTTDEINSEKGVEWPTDDESVVIENEDVDLVEETDDENADENSAEEKTEEEAGDTSENVDNPYVVSAVFANPYLDLEEDSISLKDNKLTLKMKAVDFVLDGRTEKSNLSVLNTNGENSKVSVDSAKLSSSAELEVVLNVPNANTDLLDNLFLVLAGNANETESEVKGSLKIPDPYLTVEQDYRDDEKVVLNANLSNTSDTLQASDVKVRVDGQEIEDATIKQNDGACEVSVPASAVEHDSAIEIQVESVEDYAGQTANDVSASVMVEDEGSRDILTKLAVGVAKDALSTLVKSGYKGLYNSVVNPQSETSIINAKTDEILSKMASLKTNLSNVDRRINTLYDAVQAGQYETIVNNSRTLISKIYNQEILISGKLKKFYAAEGGAAREAALKEFYDNPANATLINELAVNMGVLYDTIMSASAASGKDLIQVYDDMCATSYNWGKQTYDSRDNFREDIATVWTEGVYQIDTVYTYVTENDESENQEENLKRFQDMSAEIDKLISETHNIDETCYKQTKDGKTVYYCYTNAKWYTSTMGTESGKGWDNAIRKTRYDSMNKKYYKKVKDISVSTPFTSYYEKYTDLGRKGYWILNSIDYTTSGKTYATTSEIKAMAGRLHDGQTLEGELKEVGLSTAKYLITSEKLDKHYVKKSKLIFNDWLMDSFEIAKAKSDGSGFVSEKKFFDGWCKPKILEKPQYHENWHIDPKEMFVLSYVKV